MHIIERLTKEPYNNYLFYSMNISFKLVKYIYDNYDTMMGSRKRIDVDESTRGVNKLKFDSLF